MSFSDYILYIVHRQMSFSDYIVYIVYRQMSFSDYIVYRQMSFSDYIVYKQMPFSKNFKYLDFEDFYARFLQISLYIRTSYDESYDAPLVPP